MFSTAVIWSTQVSYQPRHQGIWWRSYFVIINFHISKLKLKVTFIMWLVKKAKLCFSFIYWKFISFKPLRNFSIFGFLNKVVIFLRGWYRLVSSTNMVDHKYLKIAVRSSMYIKKGVFTNFFFIKFSTSWSTIRKLFISQQKSLKHTFFMKTLTYLATNSKSSWLVEWATLKLNYFEKFVLFSGK